MQLHTIIITDDGNEQTTCVEFMHPADWPSIKGTPLSTEDTGSAAGQVYRVELQTDGGTVLDSYMTTAENSTVETLSLPNPHPYYARRAELVFEAAGGDPARAGALARWAQHVRTGGDLRLGVIVSEAGRIVATTVRSLDRVGATYVTWSIDGTHVDETASSAVAGFRRAHGPCIQVSYTQVCHGEGFAKKS